MQFGEHGLCLTPHESMRCEVEQLTLGEPTEFESEHFQGVFMYRIPTERTKGYFNGKTRKDSIVVQGQFKNRIAMSNCITGIEFFEPVKVPLRWIVDKVVRIFKKISGNMYWQIGTDTNPITYFCSYMSSTAQVIHISESAPKIHCTYEVQEDMSFYDDIPKFDRLKRKTFFKTISNMDGRYFEPGVTYTFEFFQHLLNTPRFMLCVLGMEWDITNYIKGQPLPLMAKTKSGAYLWNFSLWHERQASE